MYSSVSILFIPSVALLTIQNHVTSNLWHLVRQVISSSGHWTHDCQLEMIASQLTCKMLGNIWWCFWLCWLRRGRYWHVRVRGPNHCWTSEGMGPLSQKNDLAQNISIIEVAKSQVIHWMSFWDNKIICSMWVSRIQHRYLYLSL